MLNIGIWGGTFDPVHSGHLQMASEAQIQLGLDYMYMLPVGDPPHRMGVTPAKHRLKMLSAGLLGQTKLLLDDREVSRIGPSWSVISCREYRREYPEDNIVWCMGADAFAHFESWHQWQEILSLVNIAVVERPGSPDVKHSAVWRRFGHELAQTELSSLAGSVLCLSLNKVALSSTQLRAQLHAGKKPSFGLPEPVWQYINHHKLYEQ